MLRQRLSEKYSKSPYYYSTPRKHNLKEEPVLSERRLAVFGLILSLLIIAGKIFATYREEIESAIFEEKLVSYETVTEDGRVMFMEQSGHTFHLNYVFAVLVGIFVFIYMYFKGVSI
ncbi:hypothetical protein NQ314_007811 [Rhamnusium bicolor]|uniref:Uncharacterized protein n=1 Tax=Rhamnusium bicolor TaxID=1586634 RepID=A0AAV8YGL1_9CUCU|nr:hypothetical protein NQ314_007811 [Rhamnusium bicolor]